jgi:hypothetical protein
MHIRNAGHPTACLTHWMQDMLPADSLLPPVHCGCQTVSMLCVCRITLVHCVPLIPTVCHIALMQGYAHLFTPTPSSPSGPSAAAAAAATSTGGGSDPAVLLQQLPAALSDKFEGHLAVPFELWLQAHKEAKVGVSRWSACAHACSLGLILPGLVPLG